MLRIGVQLINYSCSGRTQVTKKMLLNFFATSLSHNLNLLFFSSIEPDDEFFSGLELGLEMLGEDIEFALVQTSSVKSLTERTSMLVTH